MKIEKLISEATDHIAAERYADALVSSNHLDSELKHTQIAPKISPDGASRKYTIIIVAHQKSPNQEELRDIILDLDPNRFEIIFIENSNAPIFSITDSLSGRNITLIHMDFNASMGVARNIAMRHATGTGCIFINDDSVTSAADIENLISTFEAYDAVAVRGSVTPRHNADFQAAHFDYGSSVIQRYCDVESFAIWRTESLRSHGTFDPVLSVHEGTELTVRLYPHFGPDAFLYEPSAILQHDNAGTYIDTNQKNARHKKLIEYCLHKNPDYRTILKVFEKAKRNPIASASLGIRREFSAPPINVRKLAPSKSIISTCYNCEAFIEDFAKSLNHQTEKNFELIFVDDGSDDNSPELIDRFLHKDIQRKIIMSDHIGRGGALNLALSKADYDICVMADVDDIMIPQRMAWTNRAYSMFPKADMLGFMIFDVNNLARASRPIPHNIASLQVRKLLGMPTPFPSFSFNASRIPERFDATLTSGIDCDWMFRALHRDDCTGHLIPLNTTFYRTHSGQITHTGQQNQRDVALHHMKDCHTKLLGEGNADESAIKILTGWSPMETRHAYWNVHDYGLKLIAAMQPHILNQDATQFSLIMMQRLQDLNLKFEKSNYRKLKATTTQQNKNLQDRIAASKEDLREMDKSLADTQKQLQEMRGSHSWQVTKPLRFMSSKILRK